MDRANTDGIQFPRERVLATELKPRKSVLPVRTPKPEYNLYICAVRPSIIFLLRGHYTGRRAVNNENNR